MNDKTLFDTISPTIANGESKSNKNLLDAIINEIVEKMAKSWPSDFIARKRVDDFTGGMISPKSMANYDSEGVGPEGRIKIGRNTGYIKGPFCDWLKKRTVLLGKNDSKRAV